MVGCVVVTASLFTVAAMLRAVPTRMPVNVAGYVPLPLSVTEPIVPVLVPEPRENTTVAPPAGMSLPLASFAWNVIVAVVPLCTEPELTVTVDIAGDTTSEATVIVGAVLVTATPPIVAPMERALPAVVAVNVAV